MAPRSRLSNKARSEPVLLPSKLWETWGTAVCHSLLYLLGDEHKGGKNSPRKNCLQVPPMQVQEL